MMPILQLNGVSKDFGEGDVLKGIDLEAQPGEFLTLLGPSGCGKTTTLRIIAGLEQPTQGKVLLDGQDVTALPPEKRSVNTVFQSYALFPHMNVEKNITYGLRLKGVSKKEAARQAKDMLSIVQLEGFEKRSPLKLSGGQRQRVAIARALVLKPHILLLDEPLGALDLQLRRQMQFELKKLQKQMGITFIYITHDQEEALNMSDRIGVMRDGHIEQLGTPQDIYERPQTLFAAQFIGQTNFIGGTVTARLPQNQCALDIGGITLPCYANGAPPPIGAKATLCLRTERVRYGSAPHQGIHLSGIIKQRQYAGGTQRTIITLQTGHEVICVGQSHSGDTLNAGDQAFVWWEPTQAVLIPQEAVAV